MAAPGLCAQTFTQTPVCVVRAVCECVQCVATYNHIAVYDTKRLGRSPRAVATYTGVQSAPRAYP